MLLTQFLLFYRPIWNMHCATEKLASRMLKEKHLDVSETAHGGVVVPQDVRWSLSILKFRGGFFLIAAFWLILCQLHWNHCLKHFVVRNVACLKKPQSVPIVHFSAPADRNCDRFVVQHLEYSLRGCLSHVFTHVDVTPLPCACLNQQRDGDRHLA